MHSDHHKPRRTVAAWLQDRPRLIRLYIIQSSLGFLLAGLFTAIIIWTNTANIGKLVMQVDGGWIAAVVFFLLNGLVFAGAQNGIAVMLMTEDDDRDGDHGTAVSDLAAVPVRIDQD